MATKNVEVEIELEDFDLEDLLEEITDRAGYIKNNIQITNFCKEFLNEENELPSDTLEDVLKLELFREALKKYSLTQLEEKLK